MLDSTPDISIEAVKVSYGQPLKLNQRYDSVFEFDKQFNAR